MRAAESCGFLSQAEARPEPLLQIWTFWPAIASGALSVCAAELDEEYPGHDERDADTMVRVSGSLKRSREAIAVTATPPADQIP